MTEATTSSYWIASNALYISLNANSDPSYIVGNAAAGAQILVYMKGVDGLEYDAGHNYNRWPLSLSPTYFATESEKYVYAAIPKPNNTSVQAVVVFPSEHLDIYGKNESGSQIGSTEYYYIWLRGIISATNAGHTKEREWQQRIDTGTLASDEAFAVGGENTWWKYSTVDDTVTFLKEIVMDTKSVFQNLKAKFLVLNGHRLNDIATKDTTITYIDSEDLVATPSYGEQYYLSRVHDDEAKGEIGFAKGLWVKAKGLFGIDANGDTLLRDVSVARDAEIRGKTHIGGDTDIDGVLRSWAGVFSNLIQSGNWTGDGPFDTGFQLVKKADGVTSLVVDNLFVRMKAIFTELEIRKISYAGGNIIFSHAGSRVVLVKAIYNNGADFSGDTATVGDSTYNGSTLVVNSGAVFNGETLQPDAATSILTAYRCYLLADDGSTRTENWWHVDDQARCQTFNIQEGVYQNVSNTFYWRRVVATGSEVLADGKTYDYVDLSATDCIAGSTEPQAGDQLVQMGNRTDVERQGFITIEVSGDYAPAFKVYKGVNSYSLDGKRKICLSPKYTELRVQKLVQETEYEVAQVPMQRSEPWYEGMRCYYYDLVQHKGATWLCIYPESGIGGILYTTEEPGEDAIYWRVYASEGPQGETGESAYDVLVLGADKITNGQGGIQLEARAYYGGDDVSDTLLKAAWSWQRETLSGNNTDSDNAWNAQHRGYGPQLYIDNKEVLRRALFTCEVDFSKKKSTNN